MKNYIFCFTLKWMNKFNLSINPLAIMTAMSQITLLLFLATPTPSTAGVCAISNHSSCQVVEQKLTMVSRSTHYNQGYSVALSDDRVIMGAPGGGSGWHATAIHQYNGEIWKHMQNITADDGVFNDHFGYCVDISGDFAIVGAPSHLVTANSEGAAYIFHYNGSQWVQMQKLTAADEAGVTGYEFGRSVALSGNYAVVGRPGEIHDNKLLSGSAYVYKFNGTTWILDQKFTGIDTGENFGISVDISGDDIIIGAPGAVFDGFRRGAADIFHYNGSSWSDRQRLVRSIGGYDNQFGASVAISNNLAVIGAWASGYLNTGSAYVFADNGTAWIEQQYLTADDGAAQDYFGYSVNIAGEHIIVGAHGDDDHGERTGAAYIFNFNGTTWVQAPKLTAGDARADEGSNSLANQFGYSVAISDYHALVGAIGADLDNGADTGAGYLYTCVDGTDADEDGHLFGQDCDDSDSNVHTLLVGCADNDLDGYPVYDPQQVCTNGTLPANFQPITGTPIDDNDFDDTVHPNAPELCDGLDNNQDGILPDTEIDNDADGFIECTINSGGWDGDPTVIDGDDFDDTDPEIYPGAPELCDGVDNNQNGWIDDSPNCPNDIVFQDTFEDSTLDPAAWAVETQGDISLTDGELIIFHPPSDDGAWEAVQTHCRFTGDFDVTVDFNLAPWPSDQDSMAPRLIAHDDNNDIVMEVSFAAQLYPGDSRSYYLVNFNNVYTVLLTTDLGGRLKMTRRGTTMTGYYHNGTDFVRIGSGTGSAGPVSFTLELYSGGPTAGGTVAYNNFTVISEDRYCVDPDLKSYNYEVDYFKITGNLPGSVTDEFDDEILWEKVTGTVMESNGRLILRNPGKIDTDYSDSYFQTEQASEVDTSNPAYEIRDGEGDFTAESRWTDPLPEKDHVINMGLEFRKPGADDSESIEMGIFNIGSTVAEVFGMAEGMAVYFQYENDEQDIFIMQEARIFPQDITGDVIFGFHFDDELNQFKATYSLDGGNTDVIPIGTPVDVGIDQTDFRQWHLGAFAFDFQKIYTPDLDQDNDVDGKDIVAFIIDDKGLSLQQFSFQFGTANSE